MDQGVPPDATRQWQAFFRMAFGNNEGYICIAFLQRKTRQMRHEYFAWPQEVSQMIQVLSAKSVGVDTYFCPQLLKGRRLSSKDDVLSCPTIWADLDTCPPDVMLVPPSIVIESSPNRFQALWRLEDTAPPANAEDYSRRIAYFHSTTGADKSGWDLTQLLRVPSTYNYKYAAGPDTPRVVVRDSKPSLYRLEEFERYPAVARSPLDELPEQGKLPTETAEQILQRYQERRRLNPMVWGLFTDTPRQDESWSEYLWKLQQLCYEAGMTQEEVFVICKASGCNKFARDGRPDEQLWRDVGRGYVRHMENVNAVIVPDQELSPLLSPEEEEELQGYETFVERYIKWATGLGDAAPQYHEAGAFVILSSLLASRVQLPTSFGTVLPNLWFMILADTTLTRKTTAMDTSTEMLLEVDPDVVLATDGSVEGLLQGLQGRPGRSSLFLRDEFTGLLEGMTKKDYMAGMAETFTKLYDGKFMKRILRKETIEVHNPVLILFAGGIKARTQQLLTLDWVASGFMPRFIFLTAETDVTRVQPLGPPTDKDTSGRDQLLEELKELVAAFSGTTDLKLPKGVIQQPKKWYASLTNDAWVRHAEFEAMMMKLGVNSERPDVLTPVYSRLTMSTLKAAILLAAVEAHGGEVIVQKRHLLRAVKYCEKWREYAIDVINGVGQTAYERDLARVLAAIQRAPGISRSRLMQNHHLTAQTATQIFNTLEQRGLVRRVSFGQGATYSSIDLERKS